MNNYVITKMYDRLDKICEKRYGDTDRRVVEHVLDSNPGLEKYDFLLPAGIKVYLPPRPKQAARKQMQGFRKTIQLV